MDNQLQVREQAGALADLPSLAEFGGQGTALTKNDIVIPKILAMQSMSKKVQEDKAKLGELRDSVNYFKLGSFTEAVEIIPFHFRKVWHEYNVTEQNGKVKREWVRSVPITRENDELPYNEPGLQRDRTIDIYCMIVGNLSMPHVVSFRRTSLKTGMKVITQMEVINRDNGKLPCQTAFKLSTEKATNEDGQIYAVMNVEVSRESTREEIMSAFKWYKRVTAGETRVDESDIVEDTNSSQVLADTDTEKF